MNAINLVLQKSEKKNNNFYSSVILYISFLKFDLCIELFRYLILSRVYAEKCFMTTVFNYLGLTSIRMSRKA